MQPVSDLPLDALSVETGTRPRAPKLPGVTEAHRRNGRQLAAIHRGYLWDLARIAKVLDRIEAGDAPPEALRDIVLSLDMAQNYRAFGSLCGQQCRMLAMHHSIEEHSVFPQIETKAAAGIAAVVARLRAEHEVVHELIKRLDRAAMALIEDSGAAQFAEARDVFRKLRSEVASHFHYEETELEEALGLYVDVL